MKKQLLLGCGHSREMRVFPRGGSKEWEDLYTLDILSNIGADIQCDLDATYWYPTTLSPRGGKCTAYYPPDHYLQLREDFFDEVHAYEILEHLGNQGDFEAFFDTFSNLYRILVPGGLLLATVPSRFGPWLWGDPGHRRAILPETLTFLDREQYHKQLGKTAMSDYRGVWKGDFEIVASTDDKKSIHTFVLRAIKPARVFE